jgi:hypothetical protein
LRKERKESPEASEREGFEDTHIVKFEQAIVLLGFLGSGGEEEVGSREREGVVCGLGFSFVVSSCGVGMCLSSGMEERSGNEWRERERESVDEVLG